MDVLHVTGDDFEARVRANPKTVICDFWAPWCGPCRMLAPELEAIAAAREDVVVAKVNVDDAPAVAARYGIDSIPAVLLFKGGQVVAQTVGYMTKDELLARLGL